MENNLNVGDRVCGYDGSFSLTIENNRLVKTCSMDLQAKGIGVVVEVGENLPMNAASYKMSWDERNNTVVEWPDGTITYTRHDLVKLVEKAKCPTCGHIR